MAKIYYYVLFDKRGRVALKSYGIDTFDLFHLKRYMIDSNPDHTFSRIGETLSIHYWFTLL